MALTKQYANYKRYDDVLDYTRYFQQNGRFPDVTAVTDADIKRKANNYIELSATYTENFAGALASAETIEVSINIPENFAIVSFEVFSSNVTTAGIGGSISTITGTLTKDGFTIANISLSNLNPDTSTSQNLTSTLDETNTSALLPLTASITGTLSISAGRALDWTITLKCKGFYLQ